MKQQSRSELRKKIITILYQINIYTKYKIDFEIEEVINKIEQVETEFIKNAVYGIITYQTKIDKLANKYLKDWTLDRLGNTDQAILRLGIYELLYTETPDIVSINEAIELAKIYSDAKVTKMINATLDKIYHSK